MKRTLILAFVLFFSLNACKEKAEQASYDDFAAYINGYTTGLVSGQMPVVVEVASIPSDDITTVGGEVLQPLFAFDPPVKGKAYRIAPNRFSFVPEQAWPRDKEIKVKFFLNRLIEVPKAFHLFSFSIKTLPLSFSMGEPALVSFDSEELPGYILEVPVRFSEKPDQVSEKAFGLKLDNSNHAFEVLATDSPNAYLLRSAPIVRTNARRQLVLSWNGSHIGAVSTGSLNIGVPAIDVFAVEGLSITNQPDQAVHIRFSDELNPRQAKDGLFSIEGRPFTIKVEKNVVSLFPNERIAGTFELLVAAGLEDSRGVKLKNDYRSRINFDPQKPEVKFQGKGVIMVGSENRKLPFQAVGLKAVEVQVVQVFADNMLQFLQQNALDGSSNLKSTGRLVAREHLRLDGDPARDLHNWNNFVVDLDALIKGNKASLFRVYLRFNRSDAVYPCANADEIPASGMGTRSGITEADLRRWSGSGWYNPEYYYPPNFNWQDMNDPCTDSYYYSGRFVSRNVMASDLGLIVKESKLSEKEYTLYATNMLNATPQAGVMVELYDYQQQLIVSGLTSSDGSVKLKVGMVSPFVAVASHQGNYAWVRMEQGGALSLSRFDVSGSRLQAGNKGFIYTERGVYRPGDTIHAGFMLNMAETMVPKDYPAVLELYNARQQLVYRQANARHENGLYVFKAPTMAEMPTGRWNIVVTSGAARFEHSVRVETIKPNRLKTEFVFGDSILRNNERQRQVALQVNWLHGSPGKSLNSTVEMKMSRGAFKPRQFSNYEFNDQSRHWSDFEMQVAEGATDDKGRFDFKLNIPDYLTAPGKVNLRFIARVQEQGGDISTAFHHMEFHPFNRYVGLLVPDASSQGYLLTDTAHLFEVAMVNVNETPVAQSHVRVEVYKQSWSWWWGGDGSRGNYIATSSNNLVHSSRVQIKNGKGSFKWQLDHPEWGAYFVRVVDETGGHSAARMVYFDWPRWYSRQGRAAGGGASTISLSLDKERFEAGETAVLSFPSAEGGKALISLEKGDRQVSSWWVDTKNEETSVRIKLEKDYAPNVYAHVMVLQPHGQTMNDLPIRMYGLTMISVTDKDTRLHPVVQLPDALRPETSFSLKVKEKDGKAMAYTIAIVDEGLLDLTGFRTPDPHRYFFAREALGLKTWDMFDHVIGAYGGRIEQVFAIGGDEAIRARERERQSRFKPVVHFLGPFTLKRNAENEHFVSMPNYIGSVRVMIAATSGNAYGHAEAHRPVKQPLMVLGSLPRVLRPGDEVLLPATVFNGLASIQNVDVNITASGQLTLSGQGKQTLRFEGEGEQMAYFKLKVSENDGMANVRIDVSGGGEKAYHEIQIAVQNPNNRLFLTESKAIGPGEELSLSPQAIGLENTRSNRLEFSRLPAVNLEKRLHYLNTFPYGCTEQITSTAFGQLYLAQFIGKEEAEKRNVNRNIRSAIEVIVGRLHQDGSIRYWPGGNYINDFSSVYAGHFMVLAAREGHPVPTYFLNQWAASQKALATAWQPEVYDNRILNDVVQAYRLYVLAQAGEAQRSAMNRLRENPSLSAVAANLLGAAYAVAGQDAAARELLMGTRTFTSHTYHYRHTFGSELRDKALRAEALILLGEANQAFNTLIEIAQQLGSNRWLSTQETAYSMYIIQLYLKQFAQDQGEIKLELVEDQKPMQILSTTANHGESAIDREAVSLRVRNSGGGTVHLNLISSGIPLRDDHTVVENNIKLGVVWNGIDGQALDIRKLSPGTAFDMVVTATNTSPENLDYLVLDQIIPAGWEIVNKRLMGDGAQSVAVDYTDIRDDRVTSFFSLRRGEEKVFRISLIAAYEGEFYLPPISCSAMYDPATQARKGGGVVTVRK